MFAEQLPGGSKVLVADGSHRQTAPAQIGFEAPACYQIRLLADLSRSHFPCKHGFEEPIG